MLLHFFLLLPAVHTSNIVINQYSVKQVKLDDEMINKVLVNIFPSQVELKSNNNSWVNNVTELSSSAEDLDLGEGIIRPTFENMGQKRFKKINNRADNEKFNLGDNMEPKVSRTMKTGDVIDQSDPMLLLSNLVVKLMEYLPPQLKLK